MSSHTILGMMKSLVIRDVKADLYSKIFIVSKKVKSSNSQAGLRTANF